MLVSSIGYLDANKGISSSLVKSKVNKNDSGFGHVQGAVNNVTVYEKNTFNNNNIVDLIKALFATNSEKNTNSGLSLNA